MKNEKSYTELMKSLAHSQNQADKKNVLDMYIDMVIDEAIFIRKRHLLEEKINHALDTRNRFLFRSLSVQYKSLMTKVK